MRIRTLAALVQLTAAECARHPPPIAPPQALSLTFQSDSRYCSEATAVGDTIRAHLVAGGRSITPPYDSGSPAQFVLRTLRLAQLSDSASRPLFNLDLVSLGSAPMPAALQRAAVGVEYRVRADSTTGRWYICVLPVSLIFVGDAQMKR